jgi:hypothetical protein
VTTLSEAHGPIDLILFTGDLVQAGEKKQYQELDIQLAKLCKALAFGGAEPALVTVPGNHDLSRPDPTKSAVLALANWEKQATVRDTFWNNQKSELRKCMTKSFEAYERWHKDTHLPIFPHEKGLLPGDLAATYQKGASRHRDLRVAAAGILRLLENSDLADEVCELNRLCGRACRLTNHDEEAVTHFQASLEYDKGKPSRESRSYALLEISDSLRKTGNLDAALDSAKQVKALAKPGTLLESQAELKMLNFKPASPERAAEMSAMEKKARAQGWTSHANDLSMAIYFDTNDPSKQFRLLDNVLGSDETGWNRHRAIVEKAILAVRQNAIEKLTLRDRLYLMEAYSYCHAQRLGIFNRCHEALWNVLEREGNRDGLYRLFRHSSFIWRIRGDEANELQYYERLRGLKDQPDTKEPQSISIEIRYFAKRATVLVAKLLGASGAQGNPTN